MRFVFISLFLFLLLLVVPISSAQQTAFDVFSGIFSKLFDSFGTLIGFLFSNKDIASRTLFSILIFMAIYVASDAVFRKSWLFTSVIASVVTAIAIISVPKTLIPVLLDQYGALGMIIPIIVLIIFTLRIKSAVVAQAVWAFYALYYFFFGIYLLISGSGKFWSLTNLPLFLGFIAGVFFFLLTPFIRDIIFKGDISQIKRAGEIDAQLSKALKAAQRKEFKLYNQNP